jgi:hypothetical protein
MKHDTPGGPLLFTVVFLVVFWLAQGFGVRRASAAQDEQPIAAGREALENAARFPWYDAQSDTLRPLELNVAPEFKTPALNFAFLRPLAWGVLAAALAILVVLVVYVARNRGARLADAEHGAVDGVARSAAVEALPFLVNRSRADLLGEARRHYQLGNYSEAIIYLFSYELVELDKFSLIRLAKGKTNRQYVREAARVQSLANSLALTMNAFEDVFFGRRALDRAGFEACFSRLSEFERLASRSQT